MTRSSPDERALRMTTLLPLCTPATRMAMVPGFKEDLTLRAWFEKHLRDFLTTGLELRGRIEIVWGKWRHNNRWLFIISVIELASSVCQTAIPISLDHHGDVDSIEHVRVSSLTFRRWGSRLRSAASWREPSACRHSWHR